MRCRIWRVRMAPTLHQIVVPADTRRTLEALGWRRCRCTGRRVSLLVSATDRLAVSVRGVAVCVMHEARLYAILSDSQLSETVKATDFKFDTHVSSDSPDMIPKKFPKRGRGHGHVTP